MKELTVNGRYYPFWSSLIDKCGQFERIVNIDSGMVASAKLLGMRLEPNGRDSAMVVFDIENEDGKDQWSADVSSIGVTGNPTEYKGLCLHANYVGLFILQSAKDLA